MNPNDPNSARHRKTYNAAAAEDDDDIQILEDRCTVSEKIICFGIFHPN